MPKYWHVSVETIGHRNAKVKQSSNQLLFTWNEFDTILILFKN